MFSLGVITNSKVLFCRPHVQQSYRHRQIFADSSAGRWRGVSLATKQFLRLAELREKPHCSRARWLFCCLWGAPS